MKSVAPHRGLSIEKTYLDVVSPTGDACIAYALELRWGVLRLAAASTLVAFADADPRVRTRIAARPFTHEAAEIRFRSRALGIDGRWQAGDAPVFATNLGAGLGADLLHGVRWACIAPSVEAAVDVGRRRIAGRGYAERLVLEVAPWELPIDILRWGRFASGPRSVVWIAWERAGRAHPDVVLVLVDGVPVEALEIGERRVAWRGGALAIDAGRVLRDEPLARGPVAAVAALVPGLPRGYLGSRETKWLARGRFEDRAVDPGSSCAEGWVVHEAVRFTR